MVVAPILMSVSAAEEQGTGRETVRLAVVALRRHDLRVLPDTDPARVKEEDIAAPPLAPLQDHHQDLHAAAAAIALDPAH